MGSILKFLLFVLVGLIILTLVVPLLWLVIHLVTWLFGGMLPTVSMGSDIWYILFIIACIIFIVWCVATWN